MLGIFVWTLDDIVGLVCLGILIIMAIIFGGFYLISKVMGRFLDSRYDDDEESEK